MKMRFAVVLFLFVTLAAVHAQVPSLINYQGKLLDGTNLVNTSVSVDFYVYTNSSGGAPLYIETDAGVPVVDGLYSTYLGDNPTIGVFADTLTNAQLFVEVRINGTTLSPRERIASVSYAVMAGGVTNSAISASMLADGAVTAAKLATNAVTAEKLAAGAVSNSNLGASSVTYDKILDGTIKAADLDDLAAWKPGGNSGLTGGTHFIGTLDNTPVEIRSFNTRALRLQYDGSSPLITGGHPSNLVTVTGGTIGGGGNIANPNIVTGFYGTIAGGLANRIGGGRAAIGGGFANTNSAQDGAIGGGSFNQAGGTSATIAGGSRNTANGVMSTISGGGANLISTAAESATIAGGSNNTVQAAYATIHGGRQNDIGTGSVHAAIGGGWNNEIQSNTLRATIGGGQENTIESLSYGSTIAGGYQQRIGQASLSSSIGGGYLNEIGDAASGATIAGGNTNRIDANADFGTVGGGIANVIGADSAASVIAGGNTNSIDANSGAAVIGGGTCNRIRTGSGNAAIGGGWRNTVNEDAPGAVIAGGDEGIVNSNAGWSAIGGGWRNEVQGYGAVVAGGGVMTDPGFGTIWQANRALASGSAIGGGLGNTISDQSVGSVIGGGYVNEMGTNSKYAVIGGGAFNKTRHNAPFSTIAGGKANFIDTNAESSVIGGGLTNRVEEPGYEATIAGGVGNRATRRGAAVGGGAHNEARGDWSIGYTAIAGGRYNTAVSRYAAVGGGISNTAAGISSAVSGGERNTADGSGSSVGGGFDNFATYYMLGYSTVSGGRENQATNDYATVGGGRTNNSGGAYATIPGGRDNNADGDYSFAAGRRAKAKHDGALVWADSQNADFSSITNDEFAIRATNGVRIVRNAGEDRAVPFGLRFGDNAVVAWAKIFDDGSIQNSFNVAFSTNRAMGSYEIHLSSAAASSTELEPFACVELDSQPTNAATVRFISTDQRGTTNFFVYINSGYFTPTNDEFMVVVFGR